MADGANSTSTQVQAQLDRLSALGPGKDILGLDRITRLLERIGNPHLSLPPVFHVAGTNGKGSTCAFLRAALEADGKRVHVYSSPHLVRFNERIRLAGKLIEDDALAALLAEVLDKGGDIGASFFEVTTAAAFLAFSRTPADACVIEVGLGGRLDATNVIAEPAVCGIAQLGIDHEAFLGSDLVGIAKEKAGIAKPGRPILACKYPIELTQAVRDIAMEKGAILFSSGEDWRFESMDDGLIYQDRLGELRLPLPSLPGTHQFRNLALATAMLRHQERVSISTSAMLAAPRMASWPARMQRLGKGPLTDLIADGAQLWLDGGHNAAAGEAIAPTLAEIRAKAHDAPVHIVVGMLSNKSPEGLIGPLAQMADSLTAVPVPDHEHHAPVDLAKFALELGIHTVSTASNIREALAQPLLSNPAPGKPAPVILIVGSLYLAGEVLAENRQAPD